MGLLDFIKRGVLNAGFDNIDTNNDGFITKEELGDGSISASESVVNGQITKRTILNAKTFDSFDTDKNGALDKKEVHKGFGVGEGLSTGATIAIIIGCVAVIGLIIGLAAYFSSRNAKKRKEEEQKLYEMQQKANNNGNAGLNLQSGAKSQQRQ